jgi:hypothetical protein
MWPAELRALLGLSFAAFTKERKVNTRPHV